MKVTIDRNGCIGCGLCAGICPEVFCMAEDNLAQVCGDVTGETRDGVREAKESCPVGVIDVEE